MIKCFTQYNQNTQHKYITKANQYENFPVVIEPRGAHLPCGFTTNLTQDTSIQLWLPNVQILKYLVVIINNVYQLQTVYLAILQWVPFYQFFPCILRYQYIIHILQHVRFWYICPIYTEQTRQFLCNRKNSKKLFDTNDVKLLPIHQQ